MKTKHRRAARTKQHLRDPLALHRVLDRCAPMAATGKAVQGAVEVWSAWQHIRAGTGTELHLNQLIDALNIVSHLATGMGPLVEVTMHEHVQPALLAMRDRFLRLRRVGPDAAALQHIPEGLHLYEQLLQHMTREQLTQAYEAMQAEAARLEAQPA